MRVFPMIITVCTLLSLLQLIKRFRLHVVGRRLLTHFSWGNIDLTSKYRATVRIKHVFSMNFTHFHEIVLQQGHFHCNWPHGPKCAYTENTGVDRVVMAKQCL